MFQVSFLNHISKFMFLYLILNLGSISIPLLYSIYEEKFHFIQYFKKAALSILMVGIPFLIWDVIFTVNGFWGFNSDYHLPFLIFGLPIEEILFFFCIPYACLFLQESLKYYLPNLKLSKNLTNRISYGLLISALLVFIFNYNKWYTAINFLFFIILIMYAFKKHRNALQYFYVNFLIVLIPFLIINGILTGTGVQGEVVWYNNIENLGVRIFTIPVEDIFYAFNLLLSIQLVFNVLKN